MDKNENCYIDPKETEITLPKIGGWSPQRHQHDSKAIWALNAALTAERPLLVRGEPGTGKSQLARAAAYELNRPLLYEVISARTEVTDLLWKFDAVARLADAQMLGQTDDRDKLMAELDASKYLCPGKMWWALNWETAENQAGISRGTKMDVDGSDWKNGCVLLVDEIDKADSDVPNALLESFANGCFQVPHISEAVSKHEEQLPPLVIVTTNEERELPAAFLRRCLVLHLELPKDKNDLRKFLMGRARVHFNEDYMSKLSPKRMEFDSKEYRDVLSEAADLLIVDREAAGSGALFRPGQAEYLDLCKSVFGLAARGKFSVKDIFEKVRDFSLKKNPML